MLLNNKRQEIDKIDDKLLKLFIDRLMIVKDIKDYKLKNDLLIYDEKRETEIIANASLKYKDSEYLPYLKTFLVEIMAISKKYQNEL